MKSANELWAAIMAVKQSQGMCGFRDAFEATLPAIRDEQRQECATAAKQALVVRGQWPEDDTPWLSVEAAIRNAGAAPALKPGMLVQHKDGTTGPFVWPPEPMSIPRLRIADDYRPLTRAEIDEYRERAPVSKEER